MLCGFLSPRVVYVRIFFDIGGATVQPPPLILQLLQNPFQGLTFFSGAQMPVQVGESLFSFVSSLRHTQNPSFHRQWTQSVNRGSGNISYSFSLMGLVYSYCLTRFIFARWARDVDFNQLAHICMRVLSHQATFKNQTSLYLVQIGVDKECRTWLSACMQVVLVTFFLLGSAIAWFTLFLGPLTMSKRLPFTAIQRLYMVERTRGDFPKVGHDCVTIEGVVPLRFVELQVQGPPAPVVESSD